MIALLATAQAFYYNKAKLENLLKIKLSFIKFKKGMEEDGTCDWLDEELGAIQNYIDQASRSKSRRSNRRTNRRIGEKNGLDNNFRTNFSSSYYPNF